MCAGPLDIQEVIRQRDAAITEAIEKLKPKLAKAIGKTEEELTGKAPYVPFVLQVQASLPFCGIHSQHLLH